LKAGIPTAVVKQEINQFVMKAEEVKEIINRSFLSEAVKKLYVEEFKNKLKWLQYSFDEKIL
jgi:hypothetical protein